MLRAGHTTEGYQDKVEIERKSHDDFSEYVAHQVYAKKCSHAFFCILLYMYCSRFLEFDRRGNTPLLTHTTAYTHM